MSLLFAISLTAKAQTDTLRVLGYNVLYYGNGCQGPNCVYHNYLKTIVAYTNPDILSLEKMASIPVSAGDKYATAPAGFADSIVEFALNTAYPGRYAHCPFTNNANSNNMAVIFYDQRKLGFVNIVSSYVNITDFNTYKLYYKDPNLARTHDTTFLYILPTHDRSGDENELVREMQIKEEMLHIKERFTHLPNFINMGDFNVRNSDEPCYKLLTNTPDSNFRFSDPPFYPDRKLSYPADWDQNGNFSAYLTTSTREYANIPNSAGTGGGAKCWYDHIFLSQWIVNNTDHIRYIPNSYHTVGNDGLRFNISINDTAHVNHLAPANVIDALYQMSNKYPVMLELEVTQNATGMSPANPEIAGAKIFVKNEVSVTAPVKGKKLVLHFPGDRKGQDMKIECFDKDNVSQFTKTKTVKDTDMQIDFKVKPGEYTLRISTHHSIVFETKITKG